MPPPTLRVAAPPAKPLLIFDGTCGFCKRWIRRLQQVTGDRIEYLPSQDPRIAADFPEIPPDRYQLAMQLIEPDGRVIAGAEAAVRILALGSTIEWPWRSYAGSPALARVMDAAYRVVARRRHLFGWITQQLWGDHLEPPTHDLVRWVFLRGLGLVYLVAFVSLWVQVLGLVGSHGILPAGRYIDAARQFFDARQIGLDRYRLLPTLSWLSASDAWLTAQCAAGATLAGLLVLGIAPGLCLALLWVLYLSLATIGQDFFSFQWDNLLLEAGVLAIFFAPWQWRPRRARARPAPRLVLWLLRWLVFRLMFESGCVKLLSGDPNWRHLTALAVHYQTQPLPTWIGWYAHQLPVWAQEVSCAMVFAIEILVPFLIFTPRRPRAFACAALIGLQVLILLTGNYTFFNWLAIVVCVVLLDDFAIAALLPAAMRARLALGASQPRPSAPSSRHRMAAGALAAVIVPVSLAQVVSMFAAGSAWLAPAAVVNVWLAPLRSVNGYGLFAVMTTTRQEIIVEGSDDGVAWRAYEFKDKPGDVMRRPAFVAPHQPRLEWQMWFAALGTSRENPWFTSFCVRLLEGSPQVLALLAVNPFPAHPPRYIRAVTYEYRFTTPAERRATGAWWSRTPARDYLPAISLQR